MKRITTTRCAPRGSGVAQDFDFRDEADFLKDVWEPTGEARLVLEMEMAFRRAGYVVIKSEVSPHTPPVAVFRLRRRTAPRFPDQPQFVQHIRQILESVGIGVPKGELTAQQTGNTALVAFLWQPPATRSVETGNE